MKRNLLVLVVAVTFLTAMAVAQAVAGAGQGAGSGLAAGAGPGPGAGPCAGAGPQAGAHMGMMQGRGMGPGGPGMRHGGMDRGPMGRWWKNSALVQKLGINDAQVQKIEKIFQDHRMQLIDLHASVQKAEVSLQPLVEAEHPNEAQVTAQIDKIAQARANLEKSNALMLLGIRQVLTVDQWKQLQSQRGMGRMYGGRGFGPPPPPPGE